MAFAKAATGAVLACALAAFGGCGGEDDAACATGPHPAGRPFTDVTVAWGLGDLVTSGSVCLIDHDGDGDLDLYFGDLQDRPNRLYRNDGGRFTDVTEESGAGELRPAIGCLAFDYDGDGDRDLYLANAGPDRLYRNDGGRFADVSEEAGIGADHDSMSAAPGDIDGDGDLDVAVARTGDEVSDHRPGGDFYPNLLWVNRGDGTFTEEAGARGLVEEDPTLVVRFMDLDEDGDADLYAGNDFTVEDRYHVNDGAGRFVDRAADLGVALSDVIRSSPSTMGVDVGDYDLDGSPDIVVTNFGASSIVLYDCEPGGVMGLSCRDVAAEVGILDRAFVGWGTGFVDFDHDGDLDLFAVSGSVRLGEVSDERSRLFWNESGRFVRDESWAGGLERQATSRGAAFGDLDADGDVDIVVSNMGARPQALRNDAARGRWLMIDLRGTVSNSEGVGARVKVAAGGCALTEHKLGGGSYLSTDDPRLHFGLGTATSADVEVVWPSGIVQRLADVAADQVLGVTEEPAP